MKFSKAISAIDTHIAGEVFRHVLNPSEFYGGATLKEKHDMIDSRYGMQRNLLLNEPRGHQGMTATLIVPPDNPRADYGLLLMSHDQKEVINHGALLTSLCALLETGHLEKKTSETYLVDTLHGVFELKATMKGGKVKSAGIIKLSLEPYDIVCDKKENFVIVHYESKTLLIYPSSMLGFPMDLHHLPELKEWHQSFLLKMARQSSIDYVILLNDLDLAKDKIQTLTVRSDGYIYRVPRVESTLACLFHLYKKQKNPSPIRFKNNSIFDGCILGNLEHDRKKNWIANLYGNPFVIGFQEFFLDSEDPFKNGFLIKQGHSSDKNISESEEQYLS